MKMSSTAINLREVLGMLSFGGLAANVANFLTGVNNYRSHQQGV